MLPEEYQGKYMPISLEELRATVKKEPKGVIRKRLDDGTRVTFVYGQDVEAVLKVVEGLVLEPGR